MPLAGIDLPAVEAKLALTEFFLGSTDLHGSARLAVDWLAQNAGVLQAIVAVLDPAGSNLLLIADRGIAATALADFAIGRDDAKHPLIQAMKRADATYFSVNSESHSPLEGTSFHAVPLRADGNASPLGLLLADSEST